MCAAVVVGIINITPAVLLSPCLGQRTRKMMGVILDKRDVARSQRGCGEGGLFQKGQDERMLGRRFQHRRRDERCGVHGARLLSLLLS